MISRTELYKRLERLEPLRRTGHVTRVTGLTIESAGPRVKLGELCRIRLASGVALPAEVVGFREDRVLLMPLGQAEGLEPGAEVVATSRPLEVAVGSQLLGRVLDGLGAPLDAGSPLAATETYPLSAAPPHPLARQRVQERLATGVRAVDMMLTVGQGQRLGIFAGSGVGKSTLLGMIARNTEADVNVIALIGERGREVKDFLERDLGADGLQKSVVIVATSDQPALVRLKGAFVATAIAEYFRDQGQRVMLLMDSVTRFAMAQREIGLAIGEPPSSRGYTPSVFSLLPRLLERSGAGEQGSITAFYTVLVDGDDINEPITDTVRGILDGHIFLSRDLANRNHFPAIDVLNSISRLFPDLVNAEQRDAAAQIRRLLSVYRDNEDLVNIGAYRKGSNPAIDQALAQLPAIERLLCQSAGEAAPWAESWQLLCEAAGRPV